MNGASSPNPQARWILAVLFVVSILNFVDRQILAILAGKVKADLLISDAQLGFLYGTVFGIFYAVFGVPLVLGLGLLLTLRRGHRLLGHPCLPGSLVQSHIRQQANLSFF